MFVTNTDVLSWFRCTTAVSFVHGFKFPVQKADAFFFTAFLNTCCLKWEKRSQRDQQFLTHLNYKDPTGPHRALQAHLRGPWIAPEPKEHNIFTISTSHATLLPASSHPAIVNFLAAWRFRSGVHIFWLVRKWKGIFVFDPKIEAMIQYLQK